MVVLLVVQGTADASVGEHGASNTIGTALASSRCLDDRTWAPAACRIGL